MEILFTIWLICAVFTAIIAGSKRRSAIAWLILGGIFGIFALIAVAAMPAKAASKRAMLQSGENRECPFCCEIIPAKATKCAHCQSDVPPPPKQDWLGREIKPTAALQQEDENEPQKEN